MMDPVNESTLASFSVPSILILINTSTDEGRKRIQAINAQLDKNNATIRENSSALEKQKINIGNYASALDGIVPGLGGFVNGLQGATTAAKAFIATPIGAVLAGVGLALATVIKFFKGSEEGQDALAKVTGRLSYVFEQLGQVVEVVGEAILNTLSSIGDFAMGILSMVAPAAAGALNAALSAADEITKLEDEIDARENDMIVRRAQTNKQVQELREKAITQEGAAKRKTIQEAIDLEKQLAKEETFQANERLRLIELNIAKRGKATEEEKKERAEAIAAVTDAEAQAAQSTIRFQKELERLNDESTANDKKSVDEKIKELQKLSNAQFQAELREVENQEKLREEYIKTQEELTNLIAKKDEYNQITDLSGTLAEQEKLDKEEQTEVNKEVANSTQKESNQKAIANRNTQVYANSLGQLAGVLRQSTALQKGLASSQALINTYLAATNVMTAKPPLPFPLNIIALGATIASGLAAVAQINSIQFARGGIADTGGVLNGPSHAQGGIHFAVGGRVGFEAEGGEAIINKRSTALFKPMLSAINVAGGGRAFATGGVTGNEVRTASAMAQNNFNANQMASLINQVRTVLVLQDFESVQRDRNETLNTANVLQ